MDNKKVDPLFISKRGNIRNANNNNIDNKDNISFNIFFKKFRKKANFTLNKNHNSDEFSIFKKISNDIVYNEKSHITAVFKDFLIFDDYSEFMKR